jgi:Glycosyl hydrolase family 3 N terminal domain
MTESSLLHDVLHTDLGFDGVVMSDWFATRSFGHRLPVTRIEVHTVVRATEAGTYTVAGSGIGRYRLEVGGMTVGPGGSGHPAGVVFGAGVRQRVGGRHARARRARWPAADHLAANGERPPVDDPARRVIALRRGTLHRLPGI